MEKIILSGALLSMISLNAYSQISVGTKLLGGSIGYSRYNSELKNSSGMSSNTQSNNLQKQFSFTPTVGYFIAENLAVGLTLEGTFYNTVQKGYVPLTSNSTYAGYTIQTNQKYRTLSAAPFVRYYKFLNEKFALYGHASGGYLNSYNSQSTFISETGTIIYPSASGRSQGYYSQLSPGIAFFPTNKFGIELMLRGISYQRTMQKINDEGAKSTISNFDTGFGLNSIQVGASFYLGRNS